MATYPIPECLAGTHIGNEWAIAAIFGDRVVALRYLTDIAPELSARSSDSDIAPAIKSWLRQEAKELRDLQALGDIATGIVTGDGFVEKWRHECRGSSRHSRAAEQISRSCPTN